MLRRSLKLRSRAIVDALCFGQVHRGIKRIISSPRAKPTIWSRSRATTQQPVRIGQGHLYKHPTVSFTRSAEALAPLKQTARRCPWRAEDPSMVYCIADVDCRYASRSSRRLGELTRGSWCPGSSALRRGPVKRLGVECRCQPDRGEDNAQAVHGPPLHVPSSPYRLGSGRMRVANR